MTLLLPPLTDMIAADEYTLTPEQELNLLSDRARRSRWWIAPAGTRPPGPRVDDRRLAEPWIDPWLQLNDPAGDDMIGVCVLNEADPAQGILIWVQPTREARCIWQREDTRRYMSDAYPGAMLGCETGIRVDPDYRAVFRHVTPLPQLSNGTVRWAFDRPEPHLLAWDVMTAGWLPRSPLTEAAR